MVAKVGFGIKKDFLFCLQLVCIIMEIYPVAKKKVMMIQKREGTATRGMSLGR